MYLVSTHNPVSFENALDRFLSSLRPGDIPAIVGVNSVTTMHTLNLLRRGLRMPDQMGLCGPEDWDWSPQMNWPQLVEPNVTTLMVHARELGATAARLLFAPHRNARAACPAGAAPVRADRARLHPSVTKKVDRFSF